MSEPRLEVTDSLGRRIVTIEKVPFLIGRRAGSDLHLSSAEVSRDHAEIVGGDDQYLVKDRGSRYGTFVNDAEVTEHRLAQGDRIPLVEAAEPRSSTRCRPANLKRQGRRSSATYVSWRRCSKGFGP